MIAVHESVVCSVLWQQVSLSITNHPIIIIHSPPTELLPMLHKLKIPLHTMVTSSYYKQVTRDGVAGATLWMLGSISNSLLLLSDVNNFLEA